ncbi:MAG: cobalamin-dependent protein [Syntrophobacteraceae bacterium]|jgi:methanogenic corrinoid protein MtbC1
MSDLAMHSLVEALLDGNQARSVAEARRLRNVGAGIEQIVLEGVGKAMEQLDGKCTIEQFNLLEIMLVGRAAMGVIKELFPQGDSGIPARGTVIVCSLEGDVHDIGKNILKMILTAKGYKVIDCGKDCHVDKLVETAEQHGADAICISGLITTVIPQVKTVKELAGKRGLGHIRILAGGAALKQATAKDLRVDFVADTAFDGAHFLESAVEKKGLI